MAATAQDTRDGGGESRRWTTDVFQLDTAPIPVGGCTSEAYFQQELDRIFKRTWLPVGRVTELPKPGSYLIHRIDALKVSIIVTRAKDGRIRAFHNVCAHRCNRILNEERGESSLLYCRYHGWSYSLDGRLVGMPDEAQFFGLRKEDQGLTPVAVDTWYGFIFINLDPNPRESLRDYIGEPWDGLEGYPFEQFTRCLAWKVPVKCNWKLIKDAFSELYHLPFLHKDSAAFGFVSKEQPIPRALAFELYRHGGKFSIYANRHAQYPPTATLAFTRGTAIIKPCEDLDYAAPKPRLFNPTNSPDWNGEMLQIFPSLQLSLFPQSYLYHSYMPVSVDSAIWEMRLYLAEPKNFSERFAQEFAAVANRDGTIEDLASTEGTQAVLSSGAKTHFHFSDQELLLRANHQLTQAMAGPYPLP